MLGIVFDARLKCPASGAYSENSNLYEMNYLFQGV
jgi:hypothetical protein